MKQEIQTLYALKTVLVLLIIMLHSSVLFEDSTFYSSIFPITRCGVPTFFMISGYLMFSDNLNEYIHHCMRKIVKLFKLGILGVFIYALYYWGTQGAGYVLERLCKTDCYVKWLITNEPPFGAHIWYVFAYMYLLFVSSFFFKLRRRLSVTWGGVIIMVTIVYFLIFLFCYIYNEPSTITCRWYVSGVPCFFIGWMIRKSNVENMVKPWITCSLLFVLLVITSLEQFHRVKMGDLLFSTIPLATVLFLCFLKYRIGDWKWICAVGKKYSMWIYIVHIMAIGVTKHAMAVIGVVPGTCSGFIAILFVLFLSIVFSEICRYIFNPVLR